MSKSVIQLLTLGIPSKAGTSSSVEIEKNKKIQNSPGVRDPSSSSPAWPPPMYDDPDRKTSGGGGM
jgi:hypothetical protein